MLLSVVLIFRKLEPGELVMFGASLFGFVTTF